MFVISTPALHVYADIRQEFRHYDTFSASVKCASYGVFAEKLPDEVIKQLDDAESVRIEKAK